MSNYTNTNAEVLYSYTGTGTQLATFTTEDNLQKTYPPVIIPAGFFLNPSQTFKTLKVQARGKLGTTATPTFTFTIRLLTSTTWSAGGLVLGASNAITGGSAVTLSPWKLEADIMLKTLSIGGASTVSTFGEIAALPSLPLGGTIPAGNTATNVITTFDNSTTYYLFISLTCGTSNAANLAQMEMLKVYGEN